MSGSFKSGFPTQGPWVEQISAHANLGFRWRTLKVKRTGVGDLDSPLSASASSSPWGWASSPSSSAEVSLSTHDHFLWSTLNIQTNQSAPTLPTLSPWTRGTGSSTAASTSSETVQFYTVPRWLTGGRHTQDLNSRVKRRVSTGLRKGAQNMFLYWFCHDLV